MLHVITGPMFSGKSTELARHIERQERAGKRVAIFVPSLDNRYDASGASLSTHSGLRRDGIPLDRSRRLPDELQAHADTIRHADVIVFDEGNFFLGLRDAALHLVETQHKHVIVAGLALDDRRRPFGDMESLVSVATKVQRLRAVCSCQSDDALFSARIEVQDLPLDASQTSVGGAEKYVALCRACYVKHYGL